MLLLQIKALKLDFALEVTQPFRLSLELSLGNGDRRSNRIQDPLVQPQEFDRHDEVSNENVDGRAHQGDCGHIKIMPKVNMKGFKPYLGLPWKHLYLAKLTRLGKRSTQKTECCVSGHCSIGCATQEGWGPLGYHGTDCIARKIQDTTADVKQDPVSGHCTLSHDLPSTLCEFASAHGRFKHPPSVRAKYATRGARSEAIPTHPVILCGPDLETSRKAFKFRMLNVLFQKANGQPWDVLVLQDTGADQSGIAEEVVEELGYEFDKFPDGDESHGVRGLGGELVYPSGTIDLSFLTLCGRPSGVQRFNVYKQHQLAGFEVILGADVVEHLGHLQWVPCNNRCSTV